MGTCTLCGQPAGWFSTEHATCREAEQARTREAAQERQARQALIANTKKSLAADVAQTLRVGGDLSALEDRLLTPISEGLIDYSDKREALLTGFGVAVTQFLEDGLLTQEEETRVVRFQNRFGLSVADLDKDGLMSKVAKVAVLRRVLANEPPAVQVDGIEGINLQAGETPVWLFASVQYAEDRVRREYAGVSQGVSLRVMSGVYYRIGGFRGEPIFTTQRHLVGEGSLLVTNRNLYFISDSKTMRLPLRKVVSFTPFPDAIGLVRDAASAKPQFFVTGDGWFTYNLITNLARAAS